MIGKASDLKITEALKGSASVRGWLQHHPNCEVVFSNVTTDENEVDYFYLFYKEGRTEE